MRYLLILLSGFFVIKPCHLNAQFCIPTYDQLCSSNDYIDRFTFNTLNNISSGCNGNPQNYIYDTVRTTSVIIGMTYQISVQSGTAYDQGFGVWIDFNGNGDFGDSLEFVYSSPTFGKQLFTGTLFIPPVAIPGVVRLRVRCAYSTVLTKDDTCKNFSYGETEDYNITIMPPAPKDAGAISFLSPVTNCALTDTETVTIKIQNFGADTIFNLIANYRTNGGIVFSDTLYDTIFPGAIILHTFDSTANLSLPGMHNLSAWTELQGDTVNMNDSIIDFQVIHIKLINAFPYYESFESGDGYFRMQGTAISWAYGTPAGSFINKAANGTKAWVTNLAGQYNNNEQSYLLSPCFDFSLLSKEPYIRFSHIFSTELCCDEGWVEISDDSGNTWTKLGTATSDGINWYNDAGNNWWDGNSGNSGVWRTARHPLTGMAGKPSVMLRHVFSSDGSSANEGFGFDDLFISETPDADLAVLAVDSPVTGCALNKEAVVIRIKNYGFATQDTIPVMYRINGGTIITDTLFTMLLPSDTLSFVFRDSADLSLTGTYTLQAWTALPNDSDKVNDTLSGYQFTHLTPVTSFPYTENFESGAAGWTVTGTNNSWTLGTPAMTFISGAASPANAWVTNPSGYYNNNEQSYLVSPCLSFTSLVRDPVLNLAQIYKTESCCDGFWAEYSPDGGRTWQILGSDSSGGINWYNDTANNRWAGTSGKGKQWKTAKHTLQGMAGTTTARLRFPFSSNSTTIDEGAGIDDIAINEPAQKDAGVIAIISPLSGCGLDTAEAVTIIVENFGTDTLDVIPVAFSVDGGVPFVDTIKAVSLPPIAQYTFTFSAGANLADSGIYNVKAWTVIPADGNNSNDTSKLINVENMNSISLFPFTENFETASACLTNCTTPCTLNVKWSNVSTDDMDWIADAGGTPSGNTGPTIDNTTSSATGKYIYTHASGCYNMSAQLISQCLDLTLMQEPVLSFYYHMYGADMGKLYVEVQTDSAWITIDSLIGQQQTVQTDPWLKKSVRLFPYKIYQRLRITGITGSNYRSDMAVDDISVHEGVPEANFFTKDLTGCKGDTLSFNDTSQGYPTIWLWNFGDSITDTLQSPSHVYSNAGIYSVTLIVSNAFGADTAIKINYITMYESLSAPSCIPSVTDSAQDVGIYKVTLNTISNLTDAVKEGYKDYTCLYNTTVLKGSKHTLTVKTGPVWKENVRAWIDYNNDKSFSDTTEMVLASDSKLLDHTTAFIIPADADTSESIRMRIVSDYSGAAIPQPCSTLIYGQAEDYAITVKDAPQIPNADFTYVVSDPCEYKVTFSDFSEFFPTGWSWKFGDGGTLTGGSSQVLWDYNAAGTYNVQLIVTNTYGSDTIVKTIFIDSVNAGFTVSDTSYFGDSTTFFDVSHNSGKWLWTFGDGDSSVAKNPKHIYLMTGNYVVWLFVTNSTTGCTDSVSKNITVISVPSGFWDKSDEQMTLKIFPTPSDGFLTIAYSNNKSAQIEVSIMNILGITIKKKVITSKREGNLLLDLSDLSKGLYFCKVFTANHIFVEIIIIK